jgi:hypothetical protein
VIGVADNGTILATTWDGRALVARSAEGLVTRTPPFGLSQRKVTKAERDSFTTWFTSRATYSGAQFEFPEERASFDHGQISPKGEVWLRSTESIEGRTTYIVVDAAGRVKGKVLVSVGGQIVGFGSRTQFVAIVNSTGNSDLYVLSLADSILANW